MTPAIDAEVARIMAMTDEEVLAEAKPDDLAWAERFKASIRTAIVTRPTSPPTPKEQARMAEKSEVLTTALLQQAAAIAERHQAMSARISEAFKARYGVTHSDVDCDHLIDVLDYGGGQHITLAEADSAMAACGVSRLPRTGTPS